MFWRQDLSKLDRRAYQVLEAILVEERSFKSIVPIVGNSLKNTEKKRAFDIRRHRHGKRLFIWALNQFYTLLTTESFWSILSHNPLRAGTRTRARG